MKKILAIIYRHFDEKGLDIPYFRAIILLAFTLFLNAVSISLLLDLPSKFIMPWSSRDFATNQWIEATIYFLSIIIVVSVIFRKKKIENIQVGDDTLIRAKILIPLYVIVSLVTLCILLIRKRYV